MLIYIYIYVVVRLCKVVYVYLSAFKAVNRGCNHAHRHRPEILRRTVQESLMFEPCVIEISPTDVGTFPRIIQTSWYIYIYGILKICYVSKRSQALPECSK